jgi:hypothetical protein
MKNLNWSLIKTGIVIIIITFSVYILVGQLLNMMPEKYVKDTAQVFVCIYLYHEFRKVYKKNKKD